MILLQIIIFFNVIMILNGKETYKSVKQFIERETERLKKDNIKCSVKKLTKKNIIKERLRFQMQGTHGVNKELCFIQYLEENPKDGFIWSSLGDVYHHEGNKYTGQTNFCFKQASKILGKNTHFLKNWSFLGPFGIGKTEFDGDPIEAFGGIKNISKYRYEQFEYYSELMLFGHVKWQDITQAGPDTVINIAPNIPWNDLVNSLGSLAITEWQGWLVGDFVVHSDDHFIVQCLGVSTFYIGDILLTGDVYHREKYWFPISLNRGVHTIFIPLRTKVAANIKCSIKVASKQFQILDPVFKSDLYNGYLFGRYFSISITNLHSKKWLKNIKVSKTGQSNGIEISVTTVKYNHAIAPGQTRPIIVHLTSSTKVTEDCEESGIDMELKVSTSGGSDVCRINLRCRRLDQSVLFTFLDHDGSVQHAATIKPIGNCPEFGSSCPVLVSLHGTTVPPQNQADSYKRMVNEEYLFGVDNMWLLAPTRHGAHNWEGPGLLTALTAIEELQDLVKTADWLDLSVDGQQLVVAGHSMGGHGAWHFATHYPNRVMALVSLAGWIKKEEYGDSNLYFKHDIATSHTDPVVKHIMEACISENDVDKHISNLKGIPVYARIGSADRTVHPYYVRRMYRLLKEAEIDVTYIELEGKEHWWWDTSKANDGGVVNDESIRKFVSKQYRAASANRKFCSKDGNCENSNLKQDSTYSGHHTDIEFTVSTVNPAVGDGVRGIQILQQTIPFRISTIKVSIKQRRVTMVTNNVARFSLSESPNRNVDWNSYDIQVDNTELDTNNMYRGHLHKLKGCIWTISTDNLSTVGERSPETLGPARRIAEKNFIIVVGSSGSDEIIQHLLSSAVYIANLFLLTSDTIVNIILDTDITPIQIEKKNVIILGSTEENKFTKEFLSKIPISMQGRDIVLEDCIYNSNTRTGVVTLTPNGKRNLAMLIFGNSIDGLMDAVSLAKPTIPPMTRSPFSNLIPDFVITGPEFKLKGPGGFSCSGFWDNKWKFSQTLSSCVCS